VREMPELKDVFGIFNNKGGVGKTTLSFQLQCEFALKHPDDIVVVFDMCPQANLSQLYMTRASMRGVVPGDAGVKAQADQLDMSNLPKTVAGVVAGSQQLNWAAQTNFKDTFLIQASVTNPNVPTNIYLLCGDAQLDTLAPALSRSAYTPGVIGDSFFNMHTCLSKVFQKLPLEFNKDIWGFVDTNPALTIYTHIALVASTKLIIPLLPDEFSAVAVNEIFLRVFATMPSRENALQAMSDESFEHKLRTRKYSVGVHKIDLPKIHMVIMNKTPLHGRAAAHYSNPAYQKAKDIMSDDGFCAHRCTVVNSYAFVCFAWRHN
jgi:cellulose biosynthesis protein BcsQ